MSRYHLSHSILKVLLELFSTYRKSSKKTFFPGSRRGQFASSYCSKKWEKERQCVYDLYRFCYSQQRIVIFLFHKLPHPCKRLFFH